jgi:hypothetical protein
MYTDQLLSSLYLRPAVRKLAGRSRDLSLLAKHTA